MHEKAERCEEHKQLIVAVQDLLKELRITPRELKTMGEGNSLGYFGVASDSRVQLSSVVAKKLLGVGVVGENNNSRF